MSKIRAVRHPREMLPILTEHGAGMDAVAVRCVSVLRACVCRTQSASRRSMLGWPCFARAVPCGAV